MSELEEVYELLEIACENQEIALKTIKELQEENDFLTAVIIDNHLAIKTEEARKFYEKGITISEARAKWKKKREEELRKEAIKKLGEIDDTDFKLPELDEDYISFQEKVDVLMAKNDRNCRKKIT